MLPSLLLFPRDCAAKGASIAVIYSADLDPYRTAWSGFKSLLKSARVDFTASEYSLGESAEGGAAAVAKILQRKPGLILALGTKAARLAKDKVHDAPVVFCMAFNAQPLRAENVTGVSMDIPPGEKLLRIARILPQARRIGLIYSDESAPAYDALMATSGDLGLKIVASKISEQAQFPDALKDLYGKIDCFLMVPDSKLYFVQSVKYLLLESLRNGFPVMGLSASYTKAGALFSLDCDYRDLGAQAGEMAVKILSGTPPAFLPEEGPRKTSLSVNTVISERLGIKFPAQILKEAQEAYGE